MEMGIIWLEMSIIWLGLDIIWQESDIPKQLFTRACLKIHSRRLHAPLRGIFGPDSVSVALLRLHHRDQISHKVGRTANGKQFSNTL